VRRELTKEFFECSDGHTFGYLSPKELITLLKPNVSEEVKEDLESIVMVTPDKYSNDHKLKKFIDEISLILYEEDPMEISNVFDDANKNEYDSEALDIVREIRLIERNSILRFSELVKLIRKVFVEYFTEELAGPESKYKNIAVRIWDLIGSDIRQLWLYS
ncbi:hypothetical protein DMN50_24480, partial [Priestia megaterium]